MFRSETERESFDFFMSRFSHVFVSNGFISHHKPLILHAKILVNNLPFFFPALLDSGADGNFMDTDTAQRIGIPLVILNNPLKVYATDGRVLGKREITLTLYTSALHSETISFLLTTSPWQPLILGNTWFRRSTDRQTDMVSWTTGEIIKWSDNCQINCLSQPVLQVNSTTIESPKSQIKVEISQVYQTFRDIFCKKKATGLPPQRSYDCGIELLPNTTPPHNRVYPLSRAEQQAVEEYIKEALQ